MYLRTLLTTVLAAVLSTTAFAYNFSISTLTGVTVAGATSLQFGPDNRLYVAQVDGQIKALTVQRTAPNNYQVTATEDINLVREIPNYDDSGVRNFALTKRQVTGILVVGTAANPIVYVTSSDPRIGGGSGGENDLNLDTNSGIVSRLTRTGGVWSKVDLVRGLPRSEENHASNGMQFDPITNTLYVAQGGNTNAGGPSINFAYACETALSAAILSIDLNAIDALPVKTDAYGQKYLYDLPTVNDPNPSRAHNPDGSDVNDPFGGNDGLNQAKLVAGGPVQVYASGFRNPYDLVITHAPGHEGHMYSFDNGANLGWGGYPTNEGPQGTVTNQYPEGEPGTVNNRDNLHLITGPGFYGGHPNPIRANPAGAGWFHFDNTLPAGSQKVFSASPTADWPSVPVAMADPREGDYLQPGVADGALLTNPASTNGLTEYVATNFSGAMQGNLIAASYDGKLLRVALNADGTTVTNGLEVLASGFGNLPLDVTAPDPGHGAPFVGTIWVCHYSPSKISILEPADFDSPGSNTCTGINSYEVDEDGDGFSNADEIANNSDPCSAAVRPADADGDHISDLTDHDDDNDGQTDTTDPFPLDPNNGHSVPLPIHYELFNETGIGFLGVGFTGVMMNRGEDYRLRISDDNIIAGGTAGLFTIAQVGPGTAVGAANSQKDAYQFGFNSDEFTTPFVVTSRLAGPFFNSSPTGNQTQGIYAGYGDQENYVSVALHANGGAGGVEVVYEVGGTVAFQQIYPVNFSASSTVDLSFIVDPIAGTVQPRYQLAGASSPVAVGSPIVTSGDVLMSLMGRYPLAIGLFASTRSSSTPTFSATWDYFDVAPIASTAMAKIVIDPSASSMATSSTYLAGSFKIFNLSTGGQQIESVAFDISTSIFPDIVFDTTGSAGDNVAKKFTPDAFTAGVALNAGVMTKPHNGTSSEDGYDGVDISFNAFPVNGNFTFSIDNDPNNVKGVAQPGENDAASISGLELIGTSVSVYFSDGSVQRTRVGRVENSNDGSYGWLRSDKPPKPAIFLVGESSPVKTGIATHTVRVIGPAGLTVSLVTIEGGLYLGGVPGGGYQVAPFDANTAIKVTEASGVLPSSGYLDFTVTATQTDPKAGINYVTATLIDSNGTKGAASDKLTIWYDPTFTGGDSEAPTAPTGLTATNITSRSVTLNWTSATDNTGVAGYNILRNGTLLTSVSSLTYTDIGLDGGVTYNYSVIARDGAGNTSPAATTSADTPISGTVVLRVNAGGPSYVDSGGSTWAADNGFNTGTTTTVTNAIDRTLDDTLFKTERADTNTAAPDLIYAFAIPNGTYEVQLFFAEVSTANSAVGKRVFDISLEGVLAFDDYDIFAHATAPSTAVMAVATTTVTDGQLNIAFGRNKLNPKVNAIKVVHLPSSETVPPSTPGNLHTTAVGATSVSLAWDASTDNVGVTGYVVSRNGTSLATTPDLAFTDNNLTAATAYHYTVSATDAAGNFSIPATLDVTTSGGTPDTQAPSQPGPIVFSNVTATGVTLTWTASTDNTAVTGYRVSRDGALLTTVTGLTYSDSSLTAGTAYSYSVVAIDAANNASTARMGSVTTSTTTDTQPPSAPGSVTFTNVTATTATVHWTAATDNVGVTGYRVLRNGTLLTTVTGLSFADSNLTAATAYTYAIVAIDAAGNASSASSGNVTTSAATSGTAIRINTGGTAYTDTAGNVWSADTGFNTGSKTTSTATVTGTTEPTLFKTERYDLPATPELTYTIPVPNGSYLVRLHMAETYGPTTGAGLRVFDIDLQGVRAFEDVDIFSQAGGGNIALVLQKSVSVTTGSVVIGFIHQVENPKINAIEIIPDTGGGTPDTQAPTTPGSLQSSNVTATSATLSWTASTDNVGVTGYNVSRNGVPLSTVTSTSFADAGLSPGTTYAYSVVAIDGAGNTSSAASLDVTTGTTTDTQAPTTPGPLTFTSVTANSVTLNWGASSDNTSVTGYRVSRDGTVMTTVNALTYTDSPLTPSTTYAYSIVALDASGNASTPQNASIATAAGGGGTLPTIRVNAGGPAYVDTAGNTWSADTGFNAGKTSTDSSTVNGTTDPQLFKTLRFDESPAPELIYAFPVPNGSYTVKLYLSETSGSLLAPGKRVFDVNIQGTRAFEDVDIYVQAGGGYKALVLQATANVTNGQVSIQFLHQVNNPRISAIEILPNGSTPPPTDTQPPTSPSGLAASGVTSTAANLTWTASTDDVGVTGYRVSRDGSLLATVNSTNYSDSGLTPSTAYQYGVVAIDAANNASSPATLAVSTLPPADTQAPTVPTNLAASNLTPTSVKITWDASTDNVDVTGYNVYRDAVLLGTVTATTYSDSGLTGSTTYSYSVVAVDAAGNTAASGPLSVSTPAPFSPIRINAGGPAYVDTLGHTWAADNGFNTGKSSTEAATVTGTTDPQLFKTVRFDESPSPELAYAFAVPNGTYTIRLYLAETNGSLMAAGKRVFDVRVQGALAFDNVDIYSQAGGGGKALVIQASATVNNGQIEIQFIHQVNNPRVNAIEIVSP